MRLNHLLALCLMLPARLAAADASNLERLAACMTGTFSSFAQARGDQNFQDVTLRVVRIWTDRADGPWLYAEQALTDAPSHPYRQRIYRLSIQPDGVLLVHMVEPPDLIAVTGAWKDPSRLDRVDPTALRPNEACRLVLRAQPDGSFRGGTEGQDCASSLPGADYATTEATISIRQMILWERGYTSSGTHVWGSLHGGYVFQRVE